MWHTLEVHQCPKCHETATLTLSTVVVSHNDKGEAEEKSTIDADRVYISAADVARIAGRLRPLRSSTSARRARHCRTAGQRRRESLGRDVLAESCETICSRIQADG